MTFFLVSPLTSEDHAQQVKKSKELFSTPTPLPAASTSNDGWRTVSEAYSDDHALYGQATFLGGMEDAFVLGFRSGVVSGAGLLGGQDIPLSPLATSPFMSVMSSGRFSRGNFQGSLQASGGYAGLDLKQGYEEKTKDVYRGMLLGGVTFHGSYLARLSESVVAGPYIGGDLYGAYFTKNSDATSSSNGDEFPWTYRTQDATDYSAGLAAGARVAPGINFKALTGLTMDWTSSDPYRNVSDQPTLGVQFPSLLSNLYLEQSLGRRKQSTLTTGVQANMGLRSPVSDLRPYASLETPWGEIGAAGHFQKSLDPFAPNEAGGGGRVMARPIKGVDIGLWGSGKIKSWPETAAEWNTTEFAGGLQIQGTLGPKGSDQARMTVRRSFSSASNDQETIDPWALHKKIQEMWIPETALPMLDALEASETYEEFIENAPGDTTDELLLYMSRFTTVMQERNYNLNEDEGVYNENTMQGVYDGLRDSYLEIEDNPVLVCIGAAQFAAQMINDFAHKHDLDIQARAAGVFSSLGHAITLIRTPEYGMIALDWGTIVSPPQPTMDPEITLRWYERLVGSIALHHAIRDEEGLPLIEIETQEGRIIRQVLTFRNRPKSVQNDIWDDYDNQRGLRAMEKVQDDLDQKLKK
ncbi:MAG: hypothetical protein HY547_08325 [Elusimicrobia bacterium]|nr:hypothetical protein [Elusimicrobiota bacterium]